MTNPLGFVVLARRPGQPSEPVSAVFPGTPRGLEQAQNVQASVSQSGVKCTHCNGKGATALNGWQSVECTWCKGAGTPYPDPVEYVVGEIGEWSGR